MTFFWQNPVLGGARRPNPESSLQPFSSWPEVLAAARSGRQLFYQAPLDYRPTNVFVQVKGNRLLVTPPAGSDADSFTADEGHLGRFFAESQQVGMPWGEGYVIIPSFDSKQIGGDMDAAKYGGTIASADGTYIELLKIQPVREYVGDKEAAEVGFPFWTRVASFDEQDLDPSDKDVQSAMRSVGLQRQDLDEMTPEQRAVALAEVMLDYGRGDEGPAGWSKDLPNYEVEWSWGGKQRMHDYLADEDEEFRREVLGEGEDEED